MKRTFTILLMLAIATVSSYAATYYSKITGTPQTRLTTSWSSTTDGTGASPANLTTSGDVFIIQNGHEMITGAATVFNSTNSTLQILAGGKLTATHAITVTNFIVENGGEYIHDMIQLMPAASGSITLREASIVQIMKHTPAVLPDVTWGNLIINIAIGAHWTITDQDDLLIKGDLIIKRAGTTNIRVLRLSSANNLDATIEGNLIIEGGMITVTGVNNSGKYNLTVKGDLVVEDRRTFFDDGSLSEFRLVANSSADAIFSLTVEGNTTIDKGGVFVASFLTTGTPNINLDFKGNFTVGASASPGKVGGSLPIVIFSKAASPNTIKTISMVVGGNLDVATNATFTSTEGAIWTNTFGGATVYFKGGAANSTLKMAAGQGATNIAYIVGKDKTLTLQSDLTTDKFLAVAGHVVENGNVITGTINALTNEAIAFNGNIAANAQSLVTLQDGATTSGLGLVPGMEVTSIAGNVLAPNSVITQIVDESTITISRAAVNGAAYSGAGASPANFNIEANSGVLPLTLVDFKAAREANGIRLYWKTAQESNVRHIVLERSIDGVSFDRLVALNANNSTGDHNYTYLDRNASATLNNYYRLKVEDYDGSSTYSKEIVVNPISIAVSEIKLYPNPAISYLEVSFPAVTNQGNIKIVSIDGRVVKETAVAKNLTNQRVDISSLTKGLYILVFENGRGNIQNTRFVKN